MRVQNKPKADPLVQPYRLRRPEKPAVRLAAAIVLKCLGAATDCSYQSGNSGAGEGNMVVNTTEVPLRPKHKNKKGLV